MKRIIVIKIIFIICFVSILSAKADQCIVEKVVDGDTLWCTFEDRSTKIRLLAIDTPEITNGKNECYGKEATNWIKEQTLNKKVTLQYDKEEPTYGNYGRLLAYIILDGKNLNFEMIEQGYARALTKYPIHRYPIKEIVELEIEAITNKRGLWKACY